MSLPTVSVIITCYNYGKYLKGCLDSVLNQSFSNFEIIIVNDGSIDNTDEIVENFQSLSNIKYIKQPNKGQAIAKNVGIQNSSGDFIAFLDADDAWEKDKLKKQLPLFEKNNVGVVYSRAMYVNDQGQSIKNLKTTEKYLIPKSGKVTENLFLDNFVPFSSSIIRKDCFKKCGIFDVSLQMGIDWDLWLRISTVYEFDFVDEPLLIYRVGHAGQMSKNLEIRQQCSDKIMSNFLMTHRNHLSMWTIRRAFSFTYSNRGEYYRRIDKKKSNCFFLKSIFQNPGNINSYKGLLKNLLTY